jgi:hypothetical protein
MTRPESIFSTALGWGKGQRSFAHPLRPEPVRPARTVPNPCAADFAGRAVHELQMGL